MYKYTKSGFSLIELMVVIAIIAVLAAVAIPAYSTYSSKTKLAAVLPILEDLKKATVEYYDKNGTWPTSITDVGVATADSLDSSTITSFGMCPTGCFGAINVNDYNGEFGYYFRLNPASFSFPSSVTNPTLIFNATENNGVISWYCTTDSITFDVAHNIPLNYLPSGCVSPD